MKAYSNTAYPKRGFTLLECVVTLVIAGFIGAVITATMAYGVRIYQGLRIQSVGTSQVHVAAAVVKREVEKTKLENLSVVKDKFPFDNGTVYWWLFLFIGTALLKHWDGGFLKIGTEA